MYETSTAIVNSEDRKKELYHSVINDLTSVSPIFNDFLIERNKNFDFYKGKHWTDEEELDHIDQDRIPYVFNEVQRVIEHLVGTQQQTRLDSRIVAREKGDEAKAELQSYIIKWVEQVNSMSKIESEVFLEMLLGGAACTVNTWKMEDIEYGYPCVEVIPIAEMKWDLHSIKEDMSDCRWQARTMNLTRIDVKEMFPEHVDIIDKAPGIPYPIYTVYGEEKTEYQKRVETIGAYSSVDREIIRVIEHYEKRKKPNYIVSDLLADKTYTFPKEQEALDFLSGLQEGYIEQGETMIMPDGESAIQMNEILVPCFYQTIIISDQVIEYNELQITSFPYTIAFAYFKDGEWWSFAKSLVSPQIFLNRSISLWDNIMGRSTKNAMGVIESALGNNWTAEDVRRELSSLAPVIPMKREGAIFPLPNLAVNNQLFQNVSYAIERINDYAGGKNALGLQENAAESGKAIMARASQGGVGKLPLFEKLKLWREQVTLKLLWYINNIMPIKQVYRIIGYGNEVSYINLDDGVLDTFREIKTDVIVDESVESATMKERYFNQFMEIVGRVALPPEIVQAFLLEHSNLPAKTKREIEEKIQWLAKFNQEQAQTAAEQKLQKEVEDAIAKSKLKEQMLRGEQVDDLNNEIKNKQRNIKAKLTELDQLRLLAEQQNAGLDEKSPIMSSTDNTQEAQGAISSQIQGALQRG